MSESSDVIQVLEVEELSRWRLRIVVPRVPPLLAYDGMSCVDQYTRWPFPITAPSVDQGDATALEVGRYAGSWQVFDPEVGERVCFIRICRKTFRLPNAISAENILRDFVAGLRRCDDELDEGELCLPEMTFRGDDGDLAIDLRWGSQRGWIDYLEPKDDPARVLVGTVRIEHHPELVSYGKVRLVESFSAADDVSNLFVSARTMKQCRERVLRWWPDATFDPEVYPWVGNGTREEILKARRTQGALPLRSALP